MMTENWHCESLIDMIQCREEIEEVKSKKNGVRLKSPDSILSGD